MGFSTREHSLDLVTLLFISILTVQASINSIKVLYVCVVLFCLPSRSPLSFEIFLSKYLSYPKDCVPRVAKFKDRASQKFQWLVNYRFSFCLFKNREELYFLLSPFPSKIRRFLSIPKDYRFNGHSLVHFRVYFN